MRKADTITMDCDILITGGGLAGCSAALALGKAGHSVILLDALPEPTRSAPEFDGRAYALAQASQRMLAALGLWPALADHAQPMLDIKVSDGRAGEGPAPFALHFNHAEIDGGPMGYMLEDRYLRPALMNALAECTEITHLSEHRVVAQCLSSAGLTVTTENGATFDTRLLIGADGTTSGTAQRAGIKRTENAYDQTALVCALTHEKPHHGIAHQFFMPPGPLAILPLPGNRCSIVWSETTTEAKRLNALTDEEYLDHLRPRFGDFLGNLTLSGHRYSYPLKLSLAQSFVADRVALVADAARQVHPIAGQGLNAGLRDAAALAEILTEAKRRGEDIGALSTLLRYQRWRRFDSATLAAATDGFNRLFSNDQKLLRGLRDIGMGLVQSLPSLRRSFIREAAGLTGDLPKLLKGEPL